MRVVVQVAEPAHGSGGAPPELLDAVHREGLTLESLHHEPSGSAALASWFTVAVDDPAVAERVTARARTCPRVAAVYLEPLTGPLG